MATGNRVYLLADMHLKPLDAPRAEAREIAVRDNERLARFLADIEGKADFLVLLGDAFNFWFERRGKVVGDYATALNLFKIAADKGLPIHHVSGNRDYAVGEGLGFDPTTRYPGFLRLKGGFTVSRLCDFGIEPHGPRFRFHHAGRMVSCVHGDAFCEGDRLFMMLRWLLQGPLGRAFMRWAPWSVGELVVPRLQGRIGVRGGTGRVGEMLSDSGIRREMAMGADLVLCGHIHARYRRPMEVVGKHCMLEVLPAWMDGWYGLLEDGELRVEEYR